MPRIHQLSTSVITKIAAGEVIERPASVVKELLENSIDANSTRIDIDIEQGGGELIRIVDNGHGIQAEDLPLAFANHATSKLASADDLFSVNTLGFRGEALASIGGIAQVTLQSRPPEQLIGAELSCQGGELSETRAWNGAAGTRIEVRHLFYNTPVRRKFLKAPATEMGHICEVFTRVALAHPHLHLTLRHNGKNVYELPATAGLQDRLRLFFGPEVGGRLYAIEASNPMVRIFGYIADPACDRGNGKLQYLFLNGRWIRDRSLGHALQEGYRGLIMTGRYPVAFLFLEMPPDQVDVNVHPTKAEVRFRNSQGLYGFLLSSIRDRLSRENLTARLQIPGGTNGVGFLQPQPISQSGSLFQQTGFPPFIKVSPSVPGNPKPTATEPSEIPPPTQGFTEQGTPSAPAFPSPEDHGFVKAMQVHNAYLVLETQEGMLVIDQHALHERVLFEQFKDRLRSGTLETQPLLIPEPVDLTAEQAAKTLEHRTALAELGLGVEDFGGGTVLITRYPALLGRRAPTAILKSVVDHLASQDRPPTREQLLNDLMSLMACHAAVRSGDPLNPEEIAALIALRHLAQDTHHCPHGRPTALLFTRQELDRQFRRI